MAVGQSAFVVIFAVVLFRVVYNLFEPLQLEMQNEWVKSSDRATVLSINTVIIDITSAFVSVIIGRIAQINLTGSFIFGAVLLSFSILLFSLCKRIRKI